MTTGRSCRGGFGRQAPPRSCCLPSAERLTLWPSHQPKPPADPTIGPALLTEPALPGNPEIAAREQVATAQAPGDTEMIVGGKPAPAGGGYAIKLDPDEALEGRGDFATTDPDFRACEKLPGNDGIDACDRAIASGKFTGRALSYLYSDRGYLLMQQGRTRSRLSSDLNQAADIDPTNFYAYWNRGALRMAESRFRQRPKRFHHGSFPQSRCRRRRSRSRKS